MVDSILGIDDALFFANETNAPSRRCYRQGGMRQVNGR